MERKENKSCPYPLFWNPSSSITAEEHITVILAAKQTGTMRLACLLVGSETRQRRPHEKHTKKKNETKTSRSDGSEDYSSSAFKPQRWSPEQPQDYRTMPRKETNPWPTSLVPLLILHPKSLLKQNYLVPLIFEELPFNLDKFPLLPPPASLGSRPSPRPWPRALLLHL